MSCARYVLVRVMLDPGGVRCGRATWLVLRVSCRGELGDFGRCRRNKLAVGVGVAMQAPTTVRRLGEEHPRPVGKTRIICGLGNEPGEFRDHRKLFESSPQRRSSVRVHRSTAPGAQHSSLSRSCRSRRWQVRTSNGGRRAACFTERSTHPAYLSRAHPVSLPRSYHLCRRSRASCTSTQFLHALPVSVGWRLGFLLVPALALVGGRRGEDMPGPSSEPRPIALRHRAEAGDVRRPTAVMAGAEARPAASSAPRLWSGRTRRRRWRGAVGAGRGLGTRSTRS